jgi:hypothetical protein
MLQQGIHLGQLLPAISYPLALFKVYGITHARNGPSMHDIETILIVQLGSFGEKRC